MENNISNEKVESSYGVDAAPIVLESNKYSEKMGTSKKIAAKKSKTKKSKSTKSKVRKNVTKKSTKTAAKKSIKSSTKVAISKAKRKKHKFDSELVSASRSRRYEPETVGEELLKITNTKSMEQLKRPRRVAFIIGFYVLLFMAVIVFCMIWFSKTAKPKENNELDFEYLETNSDDYFNTLKNEDYDIVEETIYESAIETTENINEIVKNVSETTKVVEETSRKVSGTTKKVVETSKSEQKNENETLKAVREATTENQSKKDNKKTVEKEEGISMITNTGEKDAVFDYSKEIYSKATYHQYTLIELNNIKAKLATLYAGVKDKVFGDMSYDIKGKNGIIYLNYKNLNDFIKERTDTTVSEYDRLIPVDRLNGEVMFNFQNAVDRGIYYDVPANNSQRSIMIKVLKGAKVGFTKDYSLTGALEILDMECNTKLNTYFNIEDIVGKTPKYKGIMPDSGFNLDDALKTKHFNYVIYDKKGYITDLMWIG